MDSDRARWRDVRWQRRSIGASTQKSARCKRFNQGASRAKHGDGDDRGNRRALGICQLALIPLDLDEFFGERSRLIKSMKQPQFK